MLVEPQPATLAALRRGPGEEQHRLYDDVVRARERVRAESPFSPSWDAAMAGLDDAERALWRPEQPDRD